MKSANKFRIVLVTAPDLKTARQLARAALAKRLIACANLVARVESHYWWQGRRERANEVLLILKTARAWLPALEKLILACHPYDTPEFLVLGLMGGNKSYLSWLLASTGGSQNELRKSPDKKSRGSSARRK